MCNNKLQIDNYNSIKQDNLEIKNELNKINELLKLCKIHPKTLQKINNQLINKTNNNIVKFGTEELHKFLSQSEILKILNKNMMMG